MFGSAAMIRSSYRTQSATGSDRVGGDQRWARRRPSDLAPDDRRSSVPRLGCSLRRSHTWYSSGPLRRVEVRVVEDQAFIERVALTDAACVEQSAHRLCS